MITVNPIEANVMMDVNETSYGNLQYIHINHSIIYLKLNIMLYVNYNSIKPEKNENSI